MKTNPNYVVKEYEKLYHRLLKQLKEAKDPEEIEFLLKHTTELRSLMTKYELQFIQPLTGNNKI